ncbi:hypothetical protein [Geodermatophilus sp. DSM 45219]|uniref:hypothetical protein n=1 Tax=Geodermatophilus sp. DSM 45219 TaxID=1881103 RepID=UPI00088111F6|nr:hypothetical protein [Geodermatophilus sp. DSM 45219]SDO05098.1 hypothetical protein SAMN05428965_2584 [Geodermatophilus sp. DSM 45219]
MNEITLLRDAGPEGPELTTATRQAARAALLAGIEGRPAVRRRRVPSRRLPLRLGAAVVAVAAAWTAAVVVTGPGASPTAGAPGGVTLVDFAMPAFPLSLPTAPLGTDGPVFGGDGGGGTSMSYVGTEDPVHGVTVHVGTEAPPLGSDGSPGQVVQDAVTVDGRPGRLTVMNRGSAEAEVAYLDWERVPGQWVTVMGRGRFAERETVTALGEDLVDGPQTVPLQLRLAPAGWRLDFFKENGRIVRLADDTDPEVGLTVHVPSSDEVVPVDQWPGMVEGVAAPVEELAVLGQPAHVARTDHGGGQEGWYLQARFPDGTGFVVQAPGDLTREQVVQIAEQVTYTP